MKKSIALFLLISVSLPTFGASGTKRTAFLTTKDCTLDFQQMQEDLSSLPQRTGELEAYVNRVQTTPDRPVPEETSVPIWLSDSFTQLQEVAFGAFQPMKISGTRLKSNATFDETNMSVAVSESFLGELLKIRNLSSPQGLARYVVAHEIGHLVQNFILEKDIGEVEDKINEDGNESLALAVMACAHSQVDVYGLMLLQEVEPIQFEDMNRFFDHTSKTALIPAPDRKGFLKEMKLRKTQVIRFQKVSQFNLQNQSPE